MSDFLSDYTHIFTENSLHVFFDSLQEMCFLFQVNCETDFVAKNEKFKDLVAKVTTTCLRDAQSHRINKVRAL